jgi:hypothetical protein
VLEPSLDKLAKQILALDEASLVSLWAKYKERVEQFEPSQEWEKAVIILSIINGVRAKNQMFNELILRRQMGEPVKPPKKKPALRLVKT